MKAWRWALAAAAAELAFVWYGRWLVPRLVEFDDVRHHVDFTAGVALPIHVVWQALGGWQLTLGLWGLVVALAWAGWRCAHALASGPVPARTLLAVQALLLGVLLLASVTFSGDVYAYVIYGRLYGLHGLNPYLLGSALPDLHDPALAQALRFYGNPPPGDVYGPLWTLLAGGLARVQAAASLGAQAWTHRAIAAAAALAASAGVLRLLRGVAEPERARRAAAFALSPVILYEAAVGGHNDLVMIAPAIWAFALLDDLPLVAGLLLGASIAVKYVSVMLVPFLVVRAARRSAAAAAIAGGLALALPALFFRPFWAGAVTLYSLAGHGGELAMSPQWLVDHPLFAAGIAGAPAFGGALVLPALGVIGWARLVQLVAAAAFLAVAAYSIARFRKSDACADLWRAAVALVVSLPIIHPWYATWTGAAGAGEGRFATFARWFGVCAFLRYALDGIAPDQAGVAYGPILITGTILMLGLPAIAAIRDRRAAGVTGPSGPL